MVLVKYSTCIQRDNIEAMRKYVFALILIYVSNWTYRCEHTADKDFEYTFDLYQTHSFAAAVTIWRQCETLRLPPVHITYVQSVLQL
jgi:hypothetical protein